MTKMWEGQICDGRCWHASAGACRCWCRGLFHGQEQIIVRDAFRKAYFTEIPERGPGSLSDVVLQLRFQDAVLEALVSSRPILDRTMRRAFLLLADTQGGMSRDTARAWASSAILRRVQRSHPHELDAIADSMRKAMACDARLLRKRCAAGGRQMSLLT